MSEYERAKFDQIQKMALAGQPSLSGMGLFDRTLKGLLKLGMSEQQIETAGSGRGVSAAEVKRKIDDLKSIGYVKSSEIPAETSSTKKLEPLVICGNCSATFGPGQKYELDDKTRFCGNCGSLLKIDRDKLAAADSMQLFRRQVDVKLALDTEKARLLQENPEMPRHEAFTRARQFAEQKGHDLSLYISNIFDIESLKTIATGTKKLSDDLNDLMTRDSRSDLNKIKNRQIDILKADPRLPRHVAWSRARHELAEKGQLQTIRRGR